MPCSWKSKSRVIFVGSLLFLASCDHILLAANVWSVHASVYQPPCWRRELHWAPLPAQKLLPWSPHRDSQSTSPRLPTRACLLTSAQSCVAQLESFTPRFPIRGRLFRVCVCVRLSGWYTELSSSQAVNNASGGAGCGCSESGVDVRAKAVTWLSCCSKISENNVSWHCHI